MMIVMPLPPCINQTYKTTRSGGFYKSADAKKWETEAGYKVIAQRGRKFKFGAFTGQIYVGLEYFVKRDRDIDSSIKIVLDLLQKMQVIENDKLINHLNVKKYKDPGNPRVEVTVEECVL